MRSNAMLETFVSASLAAHGVPPAIVTLLSTSDREVMKDLLALDQYIDLVIPRGGFDLVHFVKEHSRIPRFVESRGGTADQPDKRWEIFEQLLSSPRLPSDLVA